MTSHLDENASICHVGYIGIIHIDTKRDFGQLRGSLPKSGPLYFATKNSFPLFFVGEEALAGIY